MRALAVTERSQVGGARLDAQAMAAGIGFDEIDQGRVALVATELAHNILRHGGGGELLVSASAEAPAALELIALDQGRGMADIDQALRDGFSTAGSAGGGLGAITRQASAFDIFSRPGHGSAILARLHPRKSGPGAPASPMRVAGVSVAKPGEPHGICGDAWTASCRRLGASVLVVDGLGHGPKAAHAAQAAVAFFRRAPYTVPALMLKTLHAGLEGTRGAAAAVVHVDLVDRAVIYCGVGNIAGAIVGARMQRMVSYNGIVGAPESVHSVREFAYPFEGSLLLVLHSDGLKTGWSLDGYPGLLAHDPALIAAVLYRDFKRGTDDVTVVVAKEVRA